MILPDRFAHSPLTPKNGEYVTICFTDPALANTTQPIEITDNQGSGVGLEIELDGDGYGCVVWMVPESWTIAFCKHSTSADHVIAIAL